jgi:mannose-1-phosphate guanylyltransferase
LPEGSCCINADVHARLVGKGAPLFGFVPPAECFWSDLGTAGRYLGAHRRLLEMGRVPAGAPGRVVLRDEISHQGGNIIAPSYLGPEARVGAGASAGPFAVVGTGASVKGLARVEDSVLWPGARVEGEVVRGAAVSSSGQRAEAAIAD